MPNLARHLTAVIVLLFTLPTITSGQDNPEWSKLIEQRNEIYARLGEIQQQLQGLEGDEAEQLRTEGRGLIETLHEELFPAMREAAVEVLKSETLDKETSNNLVELAYRTYQENNFAEAAKIADAITQLDKENADAWNVAGVAHFALEDFEQAVEIFEYAQQNKLLTQLGAQFRDSAHNYLEYWERESAIREQEAAAQGEEALPRVELTTSRGPIIVELFENEAPNTVANFISLVEQGFYDGTAFHRIIGAFMAQGGCPNSKPGSDGIPGTGGPGYTIECECYSEEARRHFAGTLSMAHAGRDTGGSQFFITHLPTPHLDQPIAKDAHTVFGRVIEGMDVVLSLKANDELQTAKVIRKRNHEYTPVTTPE